MAGMERFVSVGLVLVRFGRLGAARLGTVWLGVAWQARSRGAW
jgi:hypothetical protein